MEQDLANKGGGRNTGVRFLVRNCLTDKALWPFLLTRSPIVVETCRQ